MHIYIYIYILTDTNNHAQVRRVIAEERSRPDEAFSRNKTRLRFPDDDRPWVPSEQFECQHKACHRCYPVGAERSWVSLNAVANGDIAPSLAIGFSWSYSRTRPPCPVFQIPDFLPAVPLVSNPNRIGVLSSWPDSLPPLAQLSPWIIRPEPLRNLRQLDARQPLRATPRVVVETAVGSSSRMVTALPGLLVMRPWIKVLEWREEEGWGSWFDVHDNQIPLARCVQPQWEFVWHEEREIDISESLRLGGEFVRFPDCVSHSSGWLVDVVLSCILNAALLVCLGRVSG